jgi:AAA+ superfamily predicted ATPase
VFLRVIEYYDGKLRRPPATVPSHPTLLMESQGILILTSNRVGTFDEAFKSRIQLALHFSNLDADRRAKIWAKFIDRLAEVKEDVDFDDVKAHLQALAQQPMNGRQIRNAVTTARQLARFRKTKLNYAHLKQAIGVSQKFEDYVREVKGGQDDDEIAEQDMLRVRGK